MITFDSAGLAIDTFDEILTEVQTDFRTAFGSAIATSLSSSAGQMQRLIATREAQLQEVMLAMYHALDPRLAEGVPQDRLNSLLGITREAARYATVLGTATGTATTVINSGVRLSVGGYVFVVANGPYTIGGGGTVANVELVAEELGEVDVSVLGAWTILDNVAGFTSFNDTSQTDLGRLVETNAEFRERAEQERYRRGQGPLAAIEASVSTIDEVSYVRAWHNITTDPVDANDIPYHAINVVVEGGTAAEVAAAIWAAAPAGHLFYGTDETQIVENNTVSFDRVTEIPLYVRATLTTSTAEDDAPDDLEALVEELLLAHTAANWEIGTDVVAHRLVGALSGIAGVDAITCTTSLDGITYSSAKRTISIRERATLTAARIDFIEN